MDSLQQGGLVVWSLDMATLASKATHDTLKHNNSKAAATRGSLTSLKATEYRTT